MGSAGFRFRTYKKSFLLRKYKNIINFSILAQENSVFDNIRNFFWVIFLCFWFWLGVGSALSSSIIYYFFKALWKLTLQSEIEGGWNIGVWSKNFEKLMRRGAGIAGGGLEFLNHSFREQTGSFSNNLI